MDYPDFAEAVGRAVLDGRAERGVLICGSGVGASVAANKLPGIRAGLCHDTYSAHQGVEHDDMNVLVLGGRIIGRELARELVRAFLAARYAGDERHERRLDKIRDLERRYGGRGWASEAGVTRAPTASPRRGAPRRSPPASRWGAARSSPSPRCRRRRTACRS